MIAQRAREETKQRQKEQIRALLREIFMEDSETMNGSNKRSTGDDDDRDHRDHLHHRGMQKKLRYPRDCVCSVREFAKKLDEWMFRNGQHFPEQALNEQIEKLEVIHDLCREDEDDGFDDEQREEMFYRLAHVFLVARREARRDDLYGITQLQFLVQAPRESSDVFDWPPSEEFCDNADELDTENETEEEEEEEEEEEVVVDAKVKEEKVVARELVRKDKEAATATTNTQNDERRVNTTNLPPTTLNTHDFSDDEDDEASLLNLTWRPSPNSVETPKKPRVSSPPSDDEIQLPCIGVRAVAGNKVGEKELHQTKSKGVSAAKKVAPASTTLWTSSIAPQPVKADDAMLNELHKCIRHYFRIALKKCYEKFSAIECEDEQQTFLEECFRNIFADRVGTFPKEAIAAYRTSELFGSNVAEDVEKVAQELEIND